MLSVGKLVRKKRGFFADGIDHDAYGLIVKGPYIKVLRISQKAQAETFVVDVLVDGTIYTAVPVAELELSK